MRPHGPLAILASAASAASARNGGANGATPDARRPWYSIRNLAADEAEIFIYDFIGFDPFFGGVSAADFVRELRAINARKILLRINSPGGDISEAVTIRNALSEHPAQIETHIDGLAASSASWVGLTAEKVIMSPHAMMMIHEPWFIVGGDAAYLRQQADILEKFAVDIAMMLQEKAGGQVADWRAAMQTETWYTDQETVAAGLADEIAADPAPSGPGATGGSGGAGGNRYDPAILGIFKHTPPHLMNQRRGDPAGGPPPSVKEPTEPARPQELVRAALDYQRDQSRRIGVSVGSE